MTPHCHTYFRLAICIVSCLTYAAVSFEAILPAWGQSPRENAYERLSVDPDSGSIVLQFPVRRFERQGQPGPVITTHGMVHVADRKFYEAHQAMLDPLDVVLFELVLPPGVGRPKYALQDTESSAWKIATTKLRMRSLAAVCVSYARTHGRLPASAREILEWDGSLQCMADRLAKDAWGNDFTLTTIGTARAELDEHSSDNEEDAEGRSGNRIDTIEIISRGGDNAEGGTGESADIFLSDQGPLYFGTVESHGMTRMARTLGLVFQGEVERHDRPNFRSSDLSDDQVSERLLERGEADVERKNADAWMPQRLLETIAELSAAMPGLKNSGKQFFVDVLAENPIREQTMDPDAFMKVILGDRNQVVIDDVTDILNSEPNVKSIGIVYGAAHMPGIESQLIDLGYVETQVEWIDAIAVEQPQHPMEKKQSDASRKIIRSMGLLGDSDTPGEPRRRRWRRSNTSEGALAQNYRKEMMREWIGELAKILEAPREAERDQAEGDLLKLGSDAVPYLPPVSSDASEEFRVRLERVRELLLSRDQEKLATPARATLQGSMTGLEALQSLSEQTGNSLPLKNIAGLTNKVNVDLRDMLFWESLDELLDKLALTIPPGESDRIRIVPRPEFLPQRVSMAAYCGSFRVGPVAMRRTKLLYAPDASATSIEIGLSWEPRLSPVFVRFELEGLELKCDNGEVLRPKPDQSIEYTPAGSQLVSTIEFDLASRSAREIVEWKGRFFCAIPGKPVAVSFSDLATARNSTSSNGDLKVTLERTRKNRDFYEVQLGISIQGSKNADSIQGWTSLIDAYLEDDAGNRIDNAGWSTTKSTAREIGLSFLFDGSQGIEGCRFVFVAPQSIVEQTLEYSLSGIPLP